LAVSRYFMLQQFYQPFKIEFILNYILKIQWYPHSQQTLLPVRNDQIVLCRKIFSVWCENVAKCRIYKRKYCGINK
jgi:hypothetical protein